MKRGATADVSFGGKRTSEAHLSERQLPLVTTRKRTVRQRPGPVARPPVSSWDRNRRGRWGAGFAVDASASRGVENPALALILPLGSYQFTFSLLPVVRNR